MLQCNEEDEEEDEEGPPNLENSQHAQLKQHVRNNTGPGSINSMKQAEALYEEDVIDGFAIISFETYEDLEVNN